MINPGNIFDGTYESDSIANINSIEDLVYFSDLVNQGKNFSGKTVNLNFDLDFNNKKSYANKDNYQNLKTSLTTGVGFKPIGNAINAFSGDFEGNGHIIYNLYINRPTEDNVAFFGTVAAAPNAAFVRGLTLKDVNITGKNNTSILVA